MPERPPAPSDSWDDTGNTRPKIPAEFDTTRSGSPTHTLPPAATPPVYTPPRGATPRKKRTARDRRDSGLYLPLWSLVLMLLAVLGAAFGIVLLVISIGGQIIPASQPRIVIITAVPSPTLPGIQSVLASPTPPADFGIQQGTVQFDLQGPTLPPVVFTPTRESLAVGKTVIVSAPESGLNIRSGPARTNDVLFVAPDKQIFIIVEGPQRSDDGLLWWKVQDPLDTTRTGWAAQNYLEITTPQS